MLETDRRDVDVELRGELNKTPPLPDDLPIVELFARFGVSTFGLDQKDFETEGTQLNIGMPPVAIDFLTSLPGVEFDQAWANRETTVSDEITIQYLSKADLIAAKREAARAVDFADIEELERGE